MIGVPVSLRPAAFWLGILAVCSLLLSACSVSAPLPEPAANWTVHSGQLLYRAGTERSVIGEVVVRTDFGSNFQLDLRSGPGFPLLLLRQSGETVQAEGVLARRGWRGLASRAPKPLASWARLGEVFAGAANRSAAFRGTGWQAEATYQRGSLQRLEAAFPGTGERFVFQFSR